jgi:hypothetical protein
MADAIMAVSALGLLCVSDLFLRRKLFALVSSGLCVISCKRHKQVDHR